MKDDAGVVQLFTISPEGGTPQQVTRETGGVTSAFTWSPDGRRIAHTLDGSVGVTDIATGQTMRLTPRREGVDSPEALACVFSPDGRHIAYTRRVTDGGGTFAQVFVVGAPPP
jgi:YD repeat-containing protein